jgi:hypothetical protein
MTYEKQARALIRSVVLRARREGKLSGFTIGNTAKSDGHGLYFTPLRETAAMVSAGVIVYTETEAAQIAALADGKVDYILADAEKKIPGGTGWGNVEQAVRANVRESTLWVYKGNDLSVDAVDSLLAQLTKDDPRGLIGRKIAILGAGNVGFKLALRLVERGADVTITRRNGRVLAGFVQAINDVKPAHTPSSVRGRRDNRAAAAGADIVIGTSGGVPVVTGAIVRRLHRRSVIVDVGKGSVAADAIEAARRRGIPVYRLDITAAFDGLVHRLLAVERLVEEKMGRRRWHGEHIVSGGLLGADGDFVVDNVRRPTVIYGMANGRGDFTRPLSDSQQKRMQKLEKAAARLTPAVGRM